MTTEYIISTFISVASLCVALLSVWYAKRENELSAILREEEEAENSKANIIATHYRKDRGHHVVSFINIGKADATNIRCDFSDAENNPKVYMIVGKELFPFASLGPTCSMHIVLVCVEGGDYFADFTMTWDDGFKKDNVKRLSVSLL